MCKRYRRKTSHVQAREFNPSEELPEGVEASLTPGKWWFRSTEPIRGSNKTYIGGRPIFPGDYIVIPAVQKGCGELKGQFSMSKLDFEGAYEEV